MSKKQPKDTFEVKDTSRLTDADWTVINALKRGYEEGGSPALDKALKQLADDPVLYTRIMGAFFPDEMRETLKDVMAAKGVTMEDLREIIEKAESPARRDQ